MNLSSYFPDFLTTDSLFQKMQLMGAPWSTSMAQSMDAVYFTMYSGIKQPTQFLIANSTSGVANSQQIASILIAIYGKNWSRLWDDYNIQYTPIDNYSVTETTTRNQTDDRTIGKNSTLSSTVDGTSTQDTTDSQTQITEYGHVIDNTNTTNDSTYGFNSSDAVPTSTTTVTAKETNSNTDTVTTGDAVKVATESKDVREDEAAENTTDKDVIDETITRDRTGNIGQNSYQELLNQDIELWNWNFFYRVFDDCDRLLCLSVFDPCQSNSVNPVN